ncbi:MAG: class II glutamine amidotransferase [Myxococcota bacterium]
MSSLVAIVTSDPALVRCELDRIRPLVTLEGPGKVAGAGAYQDGVVLQRRSGPTGAVDLWEVPLSDMVLLHACELPVDLDPEENAQPFRFRQWLFAHVGQLDRADAVRDRLYEQLPEFLQSVVHGATLSEVVFAQFLSELRALGRTEDPNLEAPLAASLLKTTAKVVEQASSEVGATTKARLGLVATNGRILVAARRGAQPLGYKLLEGQAECARCGIAADAKETETRVRDHRRRRSVVVASSPKNGDGWVQIPEGEALAVDRRLNVRVG